VLIELALFALAVTAEALRANIK